MKTNVHKKYGLSLFCAILAAVAVYGCGGSTTDDTSNDDPDPGNGDDFDNFVPGDKTPVSCPASLDGSRQIAFGGRCWSVRQSAGLEGPGLNYYSSDSRDVWVDDLGRLHMKISFRGGKWLCSEVMSAGVGYGRYVFYTSGDITLRDGNVVLGFFTWDNVAREMGYPSELDIELTRWGRLMYRDIHYSVQPLYGPDTPERTYPERSTSISIMPGSVQTTHVLNWTPGSIEFASYRGWSTETSHQLSAWSFGSYNVPRNSDEAGMTTPVVIPAPTDGTMIMINLWLYDALWNDDLGDPPADGAEVEVVIDGFQYTPL